MKEQCTVCGKTALREFLGFRYCHAHVTDTAEVMSAFKSLRSVHLGDLSDVWDLVVKTLRPTDALDP